MEALYTTKTKYTLQEYKKFSNAVAIKGKLILRIAILEVFIVLLWALSQNHFLLAFAIIYPILLYILQNRQIKKVWKSNKAMQNVDAEFEFYDTYFTERNVHSETRLEYSNLHKIYETKTHFYLMIAKNQGYIIVKDNCSDELQKFLRQIKCK